MKMRICLGASLLLSLMAAMTSHGITVLDYGTSYWPFDTPSDIAISGTSWVAHAITKDNESSAMQYGKEMILTGGSETLYEDNTFLADTPMHLEINYYGGALSWILNGITLGAVRPTVEFNAIEFKLWMESSGGNAGWELSNLVVNDNPVFGSWSVRCPPLGADIQELFYITDFGALSSISADLTIYSLMGTGIIDFDNHFTVSGMNAVPEPSTIFSSGIGLGILLLTNIILRKR